VAGAGWVQADIDALKSAISSGVLSVSFGGPPARTVVYQSLQAMRDLLADMVAEVTAAAGTRQPYRKAAFKSGFDE